MTILSAICDGCGIKLKTNEVYTGGDSYNRCRKCDLEHNLYRAKREYEAKRQWIARIKKELKKLNAEKN
ncbi:hypothetical protein LCGC14_2405840 [marine sediment metagenome]|uniref:Uncharacterized protein n=1 Tax=marine sediment metagenome TaxID=412755 RepID=A0A0F9CG10_9ZZZZ|nr:hypothetical protein [Desulfobacterales bacterium]